MIVTYNPYVLNNSVTLARYEDLQHQGLNPQLAVYRGKSLCIVSYSADGIIAKIQQIFKKILCHILKFSGTITTNEVSIQNLKETVHQYYYQQVQLHKQNELQTLEDNFQQTQTQHEAQIHQIYLEKEVLIQQKNQLNAEVNVLNERKNRVTGKITKKNEKLERRRAELLEARQVIQQKDTTQQEIQQLNNTKDRIQQEIHNLESMRNEIAPTQQQIEALRNQRAQLQQELTTVRADIHQSDFRQKHQKLKIKYKKLQADLNGERSEKVRYQSQFDHEKRERIGYQTMAVLGQKVPFRF